ncbi:MAG: thiamine-phosphate kinase [Magnetovibrio sp.]|nr:thiamine-phosphate kinase [Magnetovibrio sp.]
MAVNLSDLAAMGAAPRAVFLAAQFPADITEDWIMAFSTGLGEALAPSGAVLMGGDTVGTPGPLAFTLTALGLVNKGQALTRAGANLGDVLYVSGTIGDGALGLLCLTGKLEPNAHLASRYTRPQPRLALGQALAQRDLATACIDISDGLIADVGHICETSGLSIIIEAAAVPRSEACAAFPKLLNLVLGGGDDFELAFCVRPDNIAAIEALSVELDMPLTRIGECVEKGTGVSVLDQSGQIMNLGSLGYRHF